MTLGRGTARAAEPGCPDAELFSGKLITDVCWACLFPVRIAGIPLAGGTAPAGAAGGAVCSCNDALGGPILGLPDHARRAGARDQPLGRALARRPAPAQTRPPHHGRGRPLRRPPRALRAHKSQYKLSMFFPVPETQRGYAIGESTLRWSSGRNIPAVGEDRLYILWRRNDCCATFRAALGRGSGRSSASCPWP